MGTAEKTRQAYLAAMGVQAWQLRLAPPFAATGPAAAAAPDAVPAAPTAPVDAAPTSPAAAPVPVLPAQMAHASATGPFSRPVGADAPPPPEWAGDEDLNPSVAAASPPPRLQAAALCGWDALQAQVQACVRCPLHQTRMQTVFGVGDRQADWMVIGEAPGEQEDLQGEPFVGRAGLLLNEMLRAMGLARERVFIANILKCRPPKNRDPDPSEAAACEGYLKRQLALVNPKIILAVGRVAAQNLLKTTTPIGKLRGSVYDYQGVPLVVTYHPAYLLRSPLEKRNAFDDLRLALRTRRQTL